MKLSITARAEKDILRLSFENQQRIDEALNKFLTNPKELDIKKLKGHKNHWRIRFGVYRIILLIIKQEDTTYILRVRHRRESY